MSKKNARKGSAVAQPNSSPLETVTIDVDTDVLEWANKYSKSRGETFSDLAVSLIAKRREEENERQEVRRHGHTVVRFEASGHTTALKRLGKQYFVDGAPMSLRDALTWYGKMQLQFSWSDGNSSEILRFLCACAKVMEGAR